MSTSAQGRQTSPRKPALGESTSHNRRRPASASSPLAGELGSKQQQKASPTASPTKGRLRRVAPLRGPGSGGVLRLAHLPTKQSAGQSSPASASAPGVPFSVGASSSSAAKTRRPPPPPAPPSPPAPLASALLRPVRSQPSLRPPPRRQVSDHPPLPSDADESEGERERRRMKRALPPSPSFPPASTSMSASAAAEAAIAAAAGLSGRPSLDDLPSFLPSVEHDLEVGSRPAFNTLPHSSAHPSLHLTVDPAASAAPVAPRVLFRKELFLFQHEREFPHLHRRGASTTTAAIPAVVPTAATAEASAVSTATRSTPLLSPPPSPPVQAVPLAPAGRPTLAHAANVADEISTGAKGPFASFASASDDNPSAGESGSGGRSCNSCDGPSQWTTSGRADGEVASLGGRSSADMSSEADLDFAFDPPLATTVTAPPRLAEPIIVAVRAGPERSAALTAAATSVRTSFAVRPTTRALPTVAGSTSTNSSRSSSPANDNFFGAEEPSPNPSSLYTTPEHPSEPRFGPAAAHPTNLSAAYGLPSKAGQDGRPVAPPGLVRVRSNDHRRGPSSISYRFSPPPTSPSGAQSQAPVAVGNRPTLPASNSASTVGSSEAHRQAWRLSGVDPKQIERELFWRPPSPERQSSFAGHQVR